MMLRGGLRRWPDEERHEPTRQEVLQAIERLFSDQAPIDPMPNGVRAIDVSRSIASQVGRSRTTWEQVAPILDALAAEGTLHRHTPTRLRTPHYRPIGS